MREETVVAAISKFKEVEILVDRGAVALIPRACRAGLITFKSLPIDEESTSINGIRSVEKLGIIDEHAADAVVVKLGKLCPLDRSVREPAWVLRRINFVR